MSVIDTGPQCGCNNLTTASCPLRAAHRSGVSPSVSLESGSTPSLPATQIPTEHRRKRQPLARFAFRSLEERKMEFGDWRVGGVEEFQWKPSARMLVAKAGHQRHARWPGCRPGCREGRRHINAAPMPVPVSQVEKANGDTRFCIQRGLRMLNYGEEWASCLMCYGGRL